MILSIFKHWLLVFACILLFILGNLSKIRLFYKVFYSIDRVPFLFPVYFLSIKKPLNSTVLFMFFSGAVTQDWTGDLRLTMATLYQLSYDGIKKESGNSICYFCDFVNTDIILLCRYSLRLTRSTIDGSSSCYFCFGKRMSTGVTRLSSPAIDFQKFEVIPNYLK